MNSRSSVTDFPTRFAVGSWISDIPYGFHTFQVSHVLRHSTRSFNLDVFQLVQMIFYTTSYALTGPSEFLHLEFLWLMLRRCSTLCHRDIASDTSAIRGSALLSFPGSHFLFRLDVSPTSCASSTLRLLTTSCQALHLPLRNLIPSYWS